MPCYDFLMVFDFSAVFKKRVDELVSGFDLYDL